jgi:hypothetical protein
MKDYNVGWTAPGVVGGLLIENAQIPDAVSYLIAVDERVCNGVYAGYRVRDEHGLVSIRTGCKASNGNETSVSYTLVPRRAGGIYQFFVADIPGTESGDGAGSGAPAAVASARIFDASLRTVGY